ncbi:MAG: hypothetical protein ACRED2_10025, partial [Methylocella sp.]
DIPSSKNLKKTGLTLRETNEIVPVPSVAREKPCFVAFKKSHGLLDLLLGKLSKGEIGTQPCAGRRYKPLLFSSAFLLKPLSFLLTFCFEPLPF